MIVVDTNVIAYLLIEGESTSASRKLLLKDSKWIAPILWRSEFRNVLANYLRKKLFTLTQAQYLMNKAELLMNGNEYNITSNMVLSLSEETGSSAYDCEYVALAIEKGLKLVTTDKKLIKLFPDYCLHLSKV